MRILVDSWHASNKYSNRRIGQPNSKSGKAMSESSTPLHVRWIGRVPYREALALQSGMFEHGVDQHLLLLEHPHVFT